MDVITYARKLVSQHNLFQNCVGGSLRFFLQCPDLTHLPLDKIAAILLTTFSNAFS